MKILVVDDHPLIGKALRDVLKQLGEDVAIIEAKSYEAAVEQASATPDINLVLLDLGLPGVSGFEALERLREQFPAIPVVVLSAQDDAQTVTGTIDRGAMGFIPKTASTEVLISALRLVLAGGVYLPQEVLRAQKAPAPSPAQSAARAMNIEDLKLTPRQADVVRVMIQGKSNKLIMRELGLAEGTVKLHMSAILRALNVDNRTQAVIAVAKLGLEMGRIGKAAVS